MTRKEMKNLIQNATFLGNTVKSLPERINTDVFDVIDCFQLKNIKKSILGSIDFNGFYLKDNNGEIILTYYDGDEGEIDLGSTIDTIGPFCFYCNDKIRKVSGRKVKKIDAGAFSHSTIHEASFTNLGYLVANAFDSSELRRINVPKLRVIEGNAFYKCEKLKKIDLPNCSVIGYHAFDGCRDLAQVNFLLEGMQIGEGAFTDCVKLSEWMRNLGNCEFTCQHTTRMPASGKFMMYHRFQ